jgi:hypothetical protein
MGTTWRESWCFPRIFKGRQKDTGHSKSTVLFQSEYPISGQTDSRVIRLLRRKDNSSRALCRRLQVQLRCREKSTSRCRNINRLPFRGIAWWIRYFKTEFPYLLGSTNPWPTAVHMEPFPTSVLKVLIWVFATTTKICTRGRSTQDHSQGFVTDLYAGLLAMAWCLPWRQGIGSTLKRHPFSGLVHSAGELLHTP